MTSSDDPRFGSPQWLAPVISLRDYQYKRAVKAIDKANEQRIIDTSKFGPDIAKLNYSAVVQELDEEQQRLDVLHGDLPKEPEDTVTGAGNVVSLPASQPDTTQRPNVPMRPSERPSHETGPHRRDEPGPKERPSHEEPGPKEPTVHGYPPSSPPPASPPMPGPPKPGPPKRPKPPGA